MSQARKFALNARAITEKGYEDNLEVRDYLDDAEAKIFEVTQRRDKTGPEPLKGLVKKVFSSLDERFKSPDGITGVPTGFADLDTRTAGLQPTELIVLAARPAMGKTARRQSGCDDGGVAARRLAIRRGVGGAIEQLERVVESHPDDVSYREKLLALCLRASDWDRAVR